MAAMQSSVASALKDVLSKVSAAAQRAAKQRPVRDCSSNTCLQTPLVLLLAHCAVFRGKAPSHQYHKHIEVLVPPLVGRSECFTARKVELHARVALILPPASIRQSGQCT